MGNFWSTQNVQIDINHLIVDDNFNMEKNTKKSIYYLVTISITMNP